ncbi:hypothetical protein N9L20_04080 [Flavobacteriaceae bacterium]|nr:hypothetical protein [Flavobacteriaceae bacterium]
MLFKRFPYWPILFLVLGCNNDNNAPVDYCEEESKMILSSNWIDQYAIDSEYIYQAFVGNELQLNRYDFSGNLNFSKNLNINASDYQTPIDISVNPNSIFLAFHRKNPDAPQYDELANELILQNFTKDGLFSWEYVFQSDAVIYGNTYEMHQIDDDGRF